MEISTLFHSIHFGQNSLGLEDMIAMMTLPLYHLSLVSRKGVLIRKSLLQMLFLVLLLKPKTPPTTPVSKATSKSTLSPNNYIVTTLKI